MSLRLSPPDSVPGALWIPLGARNGSACAYTLVDEDNADLGRQAWHLQGGRYAVRWDHGRLVLMHRVILGAPPGLEVDHINRNGLDNRRANLRLATRSENTRNSKRSKRNTSGYRGVSFDSFAERWLAIVRFERKTYRLGSYHTAEEAAIAYDFAASALHGEFASTNFRLSGATKDCLNEFRAFLLGERCA